MRIFPIVYIHMTSGIREYACLYDCYVLSVVEKEPNVGDHGYARRTPLLGLEEEDGDRTATGQQSCTQCHLLKKQLEKEMQHTVRLQKEVKNCSTMANKQVFVM